jgi:hypothetical protein
MKTTVSNMHDLETRIGELERLQARQLTGLQQSAVGLAENFSPSRLLKSALQDVVHSPDLRATAINAAIGLGAGYLGRKIYVGRSTNVFKKMAGSGIQFLITEFIRKKIPGTQEHAAQQTDITN